MGSRGALFAIGVALAVWLPSGTRAQEIQAGDEARADALRVFLDCSGGVCDSRQFRTEISYVNWVRDRMDAQVHVMITSVGTGGGGREVRFDFYGLEALEGVDDSLFYTTAQSDTRDEELVWCHQRAGRWARALLHNGRVPAAGSGDSGGDGTRTGRSAPGPSG